MPKRLLTLVLILALTGLSQSVAETPGVHAAAESEEYYASLLETLPLKLRPGEDHRRDSAPTEERETHCKSVVYKTLSSLPQKYTEKLKNLTLFYTTDGRRGLGNGNSIVLRCLNVTDSELSAVLVHEIGHIVDIGFFRGASV